MNKEKENKVNISDINKMINIAFKNANISTEDTEDTEDTIEVEEDIIEDNIEVKDNTEKKISKEKYSKKYSGRTKTDKIFDNKFKEKDLEIVTNFTFKVDPAYDNSDDLHDNLHQKLLFDEIDKLIQESEFSEFNQLDNNEKPIKLNKIQINSVYNYIIKNVSRGYTRLEVWASLSEYFDIYPNKFYNSLSNKFKDELIIELDKVTNIVQRKKIKKIF